MLRATINGNDRPKPQIVVTVSNPAAGANWSYTVPTGSRWLLEGVTSTLTPSATVATRHNRIKITRSSVVLYMAVSNTTAAASVTDTQLWAKHGTASSAFNIRIGALPETPMLLPGDVIESTVLNLQADDQLSGVVLVFSQV